MPDELRKYPPFEPDHARAVTGQWTMLPGTDGYEPMLRGWVWPEAERGDFDVLLFRPFTPAGKRPVRCPRCQQVMPADQARGHERAEHLAGAPPELTAEGA